MSQILPAISSPALILSLTQTFSLVSGYEFGRYMNELCNSASRFAQNISLKQNYEDFECWLAPDGTRGFAVGRDRELTNVFSTRSTGDGGQGILGFAKSRYDSLHLNCFSGRLEEMYGRHGFEVTRRVANWDGPPNPDIVFMNWRR